MKKILSLLMIAALIAALGIPALATEPEPETEPANLVDVFCVPSGLAQTWDGALLVTDLHNKCVWRVEDGRSSRFAGGESAEDRYGEPMGGYHDDVPAESLFREPWAIVPFLDGWAVSDPGNSVVRLIRRDRVETVNARSGDGSLVTADMGVTFERPTGLAVDENGNLYVADTGKGVILRINVWGLATVYCQGLEAPTALCWSNKTLYVAETGAHRVVKIVRGQPQTVAGSGEQGYADGPAETAAFSAPTGLAVDKSGTVYVADTANSAVRRIRDGRVDTLFAQPEGELGFQPISPRGLLVSGGELLVCDSYSHTLLALPLE